MGLVPIGSRFDERCTVMTCAQGILSLPGSDSAASNRESPAVLLAGRDVSLTERRIGRHAASSNTACHEPDPLDHAPSTTSMWSANGSARWTRLVVAGIGNLAGRMLGEPPLQRADHCLLARPHVVG